MPPHFGGWEFVTLNTTYRDVTNLVLQYRTKKEAVEAYVPGEFEVTNPLMTGCFVMNRGVEWMAGGNYNMVVV